MLPAILEVDRPETIDGVDITGLDIATWANGYGQWFCMVKGDLTQFDDVDAERIAHAAIHAELEVRGNGSPIVVYTELKTTLTDGFIFREVV